MWFIIKIFNNQCFNQFVFSGLVYVCVRGRVNFCFDDAFIDDNEIGGALADLHDAG